MADRFSVVVLPVKTGGNVGLIFKEILNSENPENNSKILISRFPVQKISCWEIENQETFFKSMMPITVTWVYTNRCCSCHGAFPQRFNVSADNYIS